MVFDNDDNDNDVDDEKISTRKISKSFPSDKDAFFLTISFVRP